MKKIVFVCTGNTCRSPMAMAIFNDKSKKMNLNWVADSAGIASYGDPINPNSVTALAKIGINFNDYTSKRLNFQMVDESDLIVVMTLDHRRALLSAGIDAQKIIVLGGGIPDPFGGDQEIYDLCLNSINKGIESLIEGGLPQ